ncbi:MAG: hypothetical protein QM581_10805 [Pseudomonas sp.]
MRNSQDSSRSSANCRLEWRPSWWSLGAHCLLAVLALASLWISELAGWLALPLSLTVAGWAGRCLHREWWAAGFELVIPWDPARPVRVDGVAVAAFEVEWRGPLAMLRWRAPGSRREARLWWPDLLSPPARRELRLAASARAVSSDTPQMAP